MLTTGSEEVTGTDANDLIEGIVSSLSSEKTLDAADVIDGGAGSDVMNVDLKGSFTGLSTDGSIANVETINLTNDTTIDRTFNTNNITGVEKYTLTSDKAISISNLEAAGIEVNASGLQNAYSVAFDSDLDLTGTTDAMVLGLDGVGAAAVKNSSGVTTTAQNNVAVTMASIEDLTLKTSGDASFVSLAAVDATSYTVTGDADLTISAVKDGITSIDASGLSGDFTIDTTNVAGADLTSIVSGSGDDEITLDADDATPNASINGGTGADTLVLTDGSGNTVQYAMSNVETVAFANTNATTFSATNISDLETVQVNAAGTAAIDVVNLGSRDITVQTSGAIAATQDVSVDNSGTATVNFNASATSTASAGTGAALADAEQALGDVTLSNAAAAVINVNDYVDFKTATLNAAKATDLTLNVASAKNAATTPTEQTGFTGVLKAAKATSATITAEGTLNLAATSDLSAVETLNLTTTGAANISNANLESAATVILAGSAKTSALTTGTIGTDDTAYADAKAEAVDYTLSVEASGLKAGLTTSAIATAQNLTVDVSAVTGAVDLGHTASAGAILGTNVTITATEAANTVKIGNVDAYTADSGTATINANSATKAVTVGTIGTNAAFDAIVVNAADALNNVTVGDMTAADVTLNVGNTLGTITTGTITVDDSFTYTAALEAASDDALAGNHMIIDIAADTTAATSTTVTLNGNLGDDKFDITGGDNDDENATITVKGDLGIGTNDLSIDSAIAGTGKLTVDLTGLAAGGTTTVDITGTDNADTFKLSSDADIAETILYTADTQFGDTIEGFVSGTDVISFADALVEEGTEVNTLLSIANDGTVTANSIFIEITTATAAGEADTAAEIETHLAGLTSTVLAFGDSDIAVFAINDGADTYLWQYTAAGDTTVDAAELDLVAKLVGVTDIATGDLIDASI